MVIVVRVNAGRPQGRDQRGDRRERPCSIRIISNNIASATTAIRIADLGIVKTSDADTYKPSSQITYTITVVNNGPGQRGRTSSSRTRCR